MKQLLTKKNITQILIHLLFWGVFILTSLFVFTKYYWASNPFLQYFFLLISIVYVNYFWLLPFFFKKKWYALYSFLFISISFLATQLYCNVFARCGCSIMKCLSDYLWQTIVPLLFFSFLWMLFRFLTAEEKVAAIQKEHTAMELQLLKTQINPHVLFNNLNTIYAYAIAKPEKAPDLILKLSENLKHILYETNAEKISLHKELQFIDNYIVFQKIRTEGIKEINYTQEINSSNTFLIAPLLLITLIENTFKHSSTNSCITIQLKLKENELYLHCSNAYNANKKQSNTNSIGLKNLKKRLHLLYSEKHSLEIIKTNTKFMVNLKITLT